MLAEEARSRVLSVYIWSTDYSARHQVLFETFGAQAEVTLINISDEALRSGSTTTTMELHSCLQILRLVTVGPN